MEKARALDRWAALVLTNLDAIPAGAESAMVWDPEEGGSVLLRFDTAKYASAREQAEAEAAMARKLEKQQAKLDRVRHQNSGTEAALQGWRKRVRVAAARGEVPALHALHSKLLASRKRLGLRAAHLSDDEFGV